MKLALTGALTALCVALAGCATTYGGNAGGLIGGQKVTRIDEDSWQVRSSTNGFSRAGYGQDAAIYKAAILTVAAGYSHLQVYDFRIYSAPGGGHQYALMRFHMTNAPNARFRCESVEFRANCRTLSARDAIVLLAPRIPQTAAQATAEVERMRARYGFGARASEAGPPPPAAGRNAEAPRPGPSSP